MARATRLRGVVIAASLVLAGSALTAGSAGAHEGHQHGDPPRTITEKRSPDCGPGERALARAGDRFAQGCLSDKQRAALDEHEAELEPGEMASEDMELLSNIPKNGAFEAETAYSSDLAFRGRFAYAGNYEGFSVYDLAASGGPRQVAQVVCPGSQNDVSVYRNLLVLSTDSSRSNNTCTNTAQSGEIKSSWEGIKVFDISNPTSPRYVSAVETKCGSHTHTLAPSKNGQNLFAYVSSYSPNPALADCQPPHDLISVVKIPVGNPAAASLASEPVLFPGGGNEGGNGSSVTSGCHDITAYPEKDVAAGACMGDGVLIDISKRTEPVVTETVRDTDNFAFWHSATFNNRGTKVVFTDELGGGGAPTCNTTVGDKRGANGIYNINKRGKLKFQSYYKISRPQSDTENCVAHNGSLLPIKGRDVMVQAWYQGGISVFDFTDSKNPVELAWFDRGPIDDERLVLGGSWSAYYYNGKVYSNDIQQGFDTLEITERSLSRAARHRYEEFNPQSQPSFNG